MAICMLPRHFPSSMVRHNASLAALPPLLTPAPSPRAQADVITRVDEELRSAMLEAQGQLAAWVTEQKHVADTASGARTA